jgi:hypothetical protein
MPACRQTPTVAAQRALQRGRAGAFPADAASAASASPETGPAPSAGHGRRLRRRCPLGPVIRRDVATRKRQVKTSAESSGQRRSVTDPNPCKKQLSSARSPFRSTLDGYPRLRPQCNVRPLSRSPGTALACGPGSFCGQGRRSATRLTKLNRTAEAPLAFNVAAGSSLLPPRSPDRWPRAVSTARTVLAACRARRAPAPSSRSPPHRGNVRRRKSRGC